jgi:hypothetical protein
MMQLDFSKLDFLFSAKPLLIGGKAMEFYELRPAGEDIDLLIAEEDYFVLAQSNTGQTKTSGQDTGLILNGYELWQSKVGAGYRYWSEDAIEQAEFLVPSLERLFLMKLSSKNTLRNLQDANLIADRLGQAILDEVTA